MKKLISDYAVYSNLNRTLIKGYMSLLDNAMMHKLAYKHFGVYEDGVLKFQCPYSGKLYTDPKDIVLEHIIPICSGGPTTLFNCIPASKEVNSTSEKGVKHLIAWWTESSYWDKDAPKRLEKLVNYILDGLENAFNTYSFEEDFDYQYLDSDIEEEDISDIYQDDEQVENEIKKESLKNHFYSTQQLLNQCITVLKRYKIDLTSINDRMLSLANEKHIFEDINRFSIFQNAIQENVKIHIPDNTAYLTYSSNFNIKKLIDSINFTNEEDIYKEINNRLNNIKNICENNNISMLDYFKSVRDTEDVDLIYIDKEKITNEQITKFIENVSLGYETRKEIFLKMLEVANTEEEISLLLKDDSQETFKTYEIEDDGKIKVKQEYGKIRYFWSKHKEELLPIIKEKEEYEDLREKLNNHYMMTPNGQKTDEGRELRKEIFLKMLEVANTEEEITLLLKHGTTETFKTYEVDEEGKQKVKKVYGEIGQFWSTHKEELLPIIKEKEEYEDLREKLDNYYMMTKNGQNTDEGRELRKEIFLKMLDVANTEEEISLLLKDDSQETFKTYEIEDDGKLKVKQEYGQIGRFWGNHKDELLPIIKEKEEYEDLREKLNNYYMMTPNGQKTDEGRKLRKEIFLKMLEVANTEEEITLLLKHGTIETFKTYEVDEEGKQKVKKVYGEIGQFWSSYKEELLPIIKEKEEYEDLREKLNNYYMMTKNGQKTDEGRELRKEIFLKMLEVANTEEEIALLLNQSTKENFKTYEKDEEGKLKVKKVYGKIGPFWNNNKDISIIPSLFYSKEYSSSDYDNARNNVLKYLNIQRRKKKQVEFNNIEEYIDTLDKSKKKNKVLIELRDSYKEVRDNLVRENEYLIEEIDSKLNKKGKVV